jgi:hypothetical protein
MTSEEAPASEGQARLSRRRRLTTAAAAIALVVVLGASTLIIITLTGTPAAAPSPSAVAVASATAPPSPVPSATPTPAPTPVPTPTPPQYVEATTSGVLLPTSEAALATRHPIAVMVDDQVRARPQAGLSEADVVYQAPAEGGVPRYMAIFQTKDPDLIGPVRSARVYFVAWAEEWRALYVHVGGATNAQRYLYANNGQYVFNADEIHWGITTGYFDRVGFRASPHNVFTSGARLQDLCKRVATIATTAQATAPMTQAFWTFTDSAPISSRPYGGSIVVPYQANRVAYGYDRVTNTYVRGVTGEAVQTDYGNKNPITPTTVVVLFQPVGYMAYNPETTDAAKGRLEIGFNGTGRAMVFENGQAIEAVWSKKDDYSPTLLAYASGEHKGEPLPFVRGQVFVQVVPTDMAVTWTVGRPNNGGL